MKVRAVQQERHHQDKSKNMFCADEPTPEDWSDSNATDAVSELHRSVAVEKSFCCIREKTATKEKGLEHNSRFTLSKRSADVLMSTLCHTGRWICPDPDLPHPQLHPCTGGPRQAPDTDRLSERPGSRRHSLKTSAGSWWRKTKGGKKTAKPGVSCRC